MGLFDFDDKAQWNPIQMGAAILANNTRPNLGHAVGGGMRDYSQMQHMAQQQAFKRAQMEQQAKINELALKQSQQTQANTQAFIKNPSIDTARLLNPTAAASQYFKPPKAPTALEQKIELLNKDQATYDRVFPQKKPDNVTVSVGGKGDVEWAKSKAKRIDSRIAEFSGNTKDTRALGDSLSRLETILLDPDFQTNNWEDSKFKVQKFLKGAGLDVNLVDKYSKSEDFISGSGELVRIMLNQATGPQTDTDKAFLETIAPQFGKDKATNMKLVKYAKSRQQLNRLFKNRFQSLHEVKELNDAAKGYNQIDARYSQLPASVNVPDGSGNNQAVHFTDYYAGMKKANKMISDKQIIDGWMKNVGL